METPIEQEFNCLGHFGFGTGVLIARSKEQPKGLTYCNRCHMAAACWQAHRAIVKQRVPELANHIDQLGSQKDGLKKIMEFIKRNGSEPYMATMMGNMEDAIFIIETGRPKDRGPWTLKYPFE